MTQEYCRVFLKVILVWETLSKVNLRTSKLIWMSEKARYVLPNSSYSAKMYDFVKAKYEDGISWEITRDSLNLKYQINNEIKLFLKKPNQ